MEWDDFMGSNKKKQTWKHFQDYNYLQKWALGEQDTDPIITSEVTTSICPSDVTTWTYTDASSAVISLFTF